MLRRLAVDAHRARGLRILQVVLALVALFIFLAWADGPSAPPVAGRDHLALELTAPITNPRGPWLAGDVLTHEAPGIPIDVAPNATFTATYAATGVEAHGVGWTARMRIAETFEGGTWWSVERELPVLAEGHRADIAVPLAALVQEATGHEQSANVPGRLEITVHVARAVQVRVQEQDIVAVRTATAMFLPSGEVVLVRVDPGEGIYPALAERPWPWQAAVPLAGVALIEAAIAAGRRYWAPWQRAVGVHIVHVRGLVPPPATAWSDLPTLLRAARRSHGQVLLDEEAGIAVLTGVVQLIADVGKAAPSEA